MTNLDPKWRVVDQFDSTYWSGDDLQIYANDILLDTVQLTYQVIEQVVPYYGYASFVPDRLHHGTRLISGELTINFKKYHYLYALLGYLTRSGVYDEERLHTENKAAPAPDSILNIQNLSADQLRKLLDSKQEIEAEENDPNIWSSGFKPITGNVSNNSGLFQTSRLGFNLNIVLGRNLEGAKTLGANKEDEYSVQELSSFEIDAAKPSTAISLLGVSLSGCAMNLDDSGRPFMETYTFHARSIATN